MCIPNTSQSLQLSLACICIGLFALNSCTEPSSNSSSSKRFRSVPSAESGITFANRIEQTEELNIFNFFNAFHGGGVACGDLNNDGLTDLYFTANQLSNKLYLNEGGLKFKDVTDHTGANGNSHWATGVTIVDVNSDGWQDIYVCHSGMYFNQPEYLKNELFLNNGDAEVNDGIPTFTECADSLGLAGDVRTMDAVFFDYDRDNDLDVYLVNHPFNFHLPFDQRVEAEKNPTLLDSDRLLQNDGNGVFTDVTENADLLNYGFGLSACVGDLNADGWPDIFVANDYSERDNLFMNNGDGTFTDKALSSLFHISNFSMGTDIADFNNDLLPDMICVDMMAEDNRRKKINMSAMNPAIFWETVDAGRHHQYMQNTLQLNNGNGTFSDVAMMSDLAFTDWSWSPIFADLDNDGWKDIFISNGMLKDIRNTDANQNMLGKDLQEIFGNFKELTETLPSEPIPNYVFHNDQGITFSNRSKEWGLDMPGFSNGAVIADLDQDGDLDLVLNNLESEASVFENTGSDDHHFIQISPNGPRGNPNGVGLTAIIHYQRVAQSQQLSLSRGSQSSTQPLIHFGLGKAESIDSLVLHWPDGKYQLIIDPKVDTRITAYYSEAVDSKGGFHERATMFSESQYEIPFTHKETEYNDFDQEILLPHKYSQLGPALAVGDLNGDSLDDLILGGTSPNAPTALFQLKQGGWKSEKLALPAVDLNSEITDIHLFDLDQDGDLDIYLSAGSNEWIVGHDNYRDKVLVNDGSGNFDFRKDIIPNTRFSSSCARSCDVDGDGDLDLFVGSRIIPRNYPKPASSTLLLNEEGCFVDVTAEQAPELIEFGMVTDAEWVDLGNDERMELVVVGEWMPISIFRYADGKLTDVSSEFDLGNMVGWWQSVTVANLNADSQPDLVIGNLGLNSKFKATVDHPFHVYYDDFDGNGKGDIVLSYEQAGEVYPVRGRSCSADQIPTLKKQFPTYESFGTATVQSMLQEKVETALHYEANIFESVALISNENGGFEVSLLPKESQISIAKDAVATDLDQDGLDDLILIGNDYNTEVETSRYDASIGTVLLNVDGTSFKPIPYSKSGFSNIGDARKIGLYQGPGGEHHVVVTNNNSVTSSFKINKSIQD